MPVNDLITIRKGTAAQWSSSNPVLASGEPGYDTTNNIIKIGDGSTAWNSLANHKHSSSDISNLPVTNITAGTNISVSSSSGNFTISSSGISDPYDLGTYPLITISSQPSSVSVSTSSSTTLAITAAATSPTATIAYQWQVSTNSGSTWSNVSGATSSSLTLTNIAQGSYQYRCYLTANLSAIYSNAATVTVTSPFTAVAVLLTSGTSYTVPAGATNMKAWAIGAGGNINAANQAAAAGGTAFKSWSVTGGQSVTYSVGAAAVGDLGGNTTVTFSATTITGNGGNGLTAGSFSGGDGGATGGAGESFGAGDASGGAVGGNGTKQSCGRKIATDVSGLLAAVALAGGKTTEDCGTVAAFGSGGATGKYRVRKNPGIGGGMNSGWGTPSTGAVILYFT